MSVDDLNLSWRLRTKKVIYVFLS